MKITTSQCSVRGEKLWRVRWMESGRVQRKFFGGREAAETFAARLRGEQVSARRGLTTIPADAQEMLLKLYEAALAKGAPLEGCFRYVSDAYEAANAPEVSSPVLEDVIKEMELAKRKAGRAERYLGSMRVVVDQFAKGRERLPINKIGHAEVEKFMDTKRMPIALAFLPLKKTVGGNQAARMLERLAKSIPAGQRFRPRIDARVADAFIFRPGWNHAPAHEFHRGLVAFVVNHRRKLRRRDVVTRPKNWHPRHDDANEFDQLGKIFCRYVSSAHGRRLIYQNYHGPAQFHRPTRGSGQRDKGKSLNLFIFQSIFRFMKFSFSGNYIWIIRF